MQGPELREDLVAGLEAGDLLPHGHDCACAIGAGHNILTHRERIQAFGDDEVSVVEGGIVHVHEDIVGADFGNRRGGFEM